MYGDFLTVLWGGGGGGGGGGGVHMEALRGNFDLVSPVQISHTKS